MISDLSTQDLTVFNAQHWAPTMQEMYFKNNVARALCTEELRDVLVDGTRVHRPYRKIGRDVSYTKGTTITSWNDLGGTNEYLDVDTVRLVPSYVDDLDQLQNKWDVAALTASDSQMLLNNRIDQKVFSLYGNAGSYVSAQDLGGSGTGAVAINTSNISNLFTVSDRNLNKYNRVGGTKFAAIGPRLLEQIKLGVSSRETPFGDTVGANGMVGSRFGFDIHLTNNIPFSTTVVTSGILTDGQFFYVDGVKFTWEADGGNCDAAGEVDIGTNEDEAYANLVLAINGTTAATADTYYDVSGDDREALILGGITASYTAHALIISGYGDVVISLGTTSNVTSVTTTSYPIFGLKGAIDFVVQKEPHVEFRTCENLLGRKIYAWTTYGAKVFTKEKKSLVYAKVDASDWV